MPSISARCKCADIIRKEGVKTLFGKDCSVIKTIDPMAKEREFFNASELMATKCKNIVGLRHELGSPVQLKTPWYNGMECEIKGDAYDRVTIYGKKYCHR